jgi:hypothetical protein
MLNGRCEEAMRWLDRIANVQPSVLRGDVTASYCLGRENRWEEAIDLLRPLVERGGPKMLGFLGHTLGFAARRADDRSGNQRAAWLDEARAIRDTLVAQVEGGAFDAAVVSAGVGGELDTTFDWLERSIEDRSMDWYIMEPRFEELHRHPRFNTIRTRLGIQNR